MRLKMTTDYALRIIRTIYLDEDRIVTSKTIFQKEGISQGVIVKVLKRLKDCNIVESHQGRGNNVGGFSLKVNLEELTLYDIVEVMEGTIDFSFQRDSAYNVRFGSNCRINQELLRVSKNTQDGLKMNSLYEVLIGEKIKKKA